MFELTTKSGNTITLFTDYKKITSKQMKAVRYYIESFLNEPIIMEFKPVTKANPLLLLLLKKWLLDLTKRTNRGEK